jgi:chromosome segregation ATPase
VCGLDLCEDGARTLTRESVATGQDQLSQASSRGVGQTGGAYDFERLERAIDFLIGEHERLSSEKAELLEELVEREQRLTSLQSRLDTEKAQRLSAVESVDKILGRLEQLQTSVTNTTVGKTPAEGAL